jgi:hypothetical protein
MGNMNLTEIIASCGGTDEIGRVIDGATHHAVKKWRTNGIPEKHWAALIALNPTLTPQTLHGANEAVRAAA